MKTVADEEDDEESVWSQHRSQHGPSNGRSKTAENSSVVHVVTAFPKEKEKRESTPCIEAGEIRNAGANEMQCADAATTWTTTTTSQQRTAFAQWVRERLTKGPASQGVLVAEGVSRFNLGTLEARNVIADVGEMYMNGNNVPHWKLP